MDKLIFHLFADLTVFDQNPILERFMAVREDARTRGRLGVILEDSLRLF
ncbi:hypothetical protein [Priestia endophytica]|nr:hypothetical protein [Priestia endophytica]MCM3540776.1 hypothetical protein [Priestia endophytica]